MSSAPAVPVPPAPGPVGSGTVPTSAPGAGLRRWGKILSILGGIILLLSVVIGVIMSVTGFGKALSVEEEGTVFTGSTSVTVEAGQEVQLYVHEGETPPSCTVEPAADITDSSMTYTVSNGDVSWVSFQGFTAAKAGTYTIDCAGDTEVLAGPPVSVGGILSAIGGIFLGILGGGLGALLLVLGLILYFVGRSKAKNAAA
ncbi:hypothetical protein [Brachybacterium huguangmaarense]